MGNKDLENKILKVGMWIFTFFFWYLVVAFFLKSDYPIYDQPFNRKDAYEALRDGLTLSAYFLAPAVAFILFNDWRSQHKIIKNEIVSQEILKILNSDFLEFYNLNPRNKLDFDRFNEYQMIFHRNVATLYIKVDEINVIDSNSQEFKNAILGLEKELKGVYETILKQMQIVYEIDAIKDHLDTQSSKRKLELFSNLSDYSHQNDKFYTNIQMVTDKLKPLTI